MQPAPVTIYKCPFCSERYQVGGEVQSAPPEVLEVWSDGEEVLTWSSAAFRPVILCSSCKNFFAKRTSYSESRGALSIADSNSIRKPQRLTLEDTMRMLDDRVLQLELGKRFTYSRDSLQSLPDSSQTEEDIINHATYTIHCLIIVRLNDEIREHGYDRLSRERRDVLLKSARAALARMPHDDDPGHLIWKAELHRYLGEFRNSITTLRPITDKPYLSTKRKLLLLNRLGNQKLQLIWTKGGFFKNLKIWMRWLQS